jgi:hypothetical protein
VHRELYRYKGVDLALVGNNIVIGLQKKLKKRAANLGFHLVPNEDKKLFERVNIIKHIWIILIERCSL